MSTKYLESMHKDNNYRTLDNGSGEQAAQVTEPQYNVPGILQRVNGNLLRFNNSEWYGTTE